MDATITPTAPMHRCLFQIFFSIMIILLCLNIAGSEFDKDISWTELPKSLIPK